MHGSRLQRTVSADSAAHEETDAFLLISRYGVCQPPFKAGKGYKTVSRLKNKRNGEAYRRDIAWKTVVLALLLVAVFAILVWNAFDSDAAASVITLVTLLMVAAIVALEWRSTERSHEEQLRMKASNERLNLALRNMTATIWDYDLAARQILQTEGSQEKHGFTSAVSNVPESLIECGYVHPDSVDAFRAMYDKLFAGEPRAEGVFRMRSADREDWWYEHIQYVTLFNDAGKPYRAIGIGQDVTDKQRLAAAAETDSLTGLLNHNATLEHIKRLLAAEGEAGIGALFIIDLDYFKQVNDTLGHQTGDETLARIAGIIRESFRSEDVVGRIGGDEFMVFLCRAPHADIIRKKACQLIQALQFHCGDGNTGVALSASVGIAIRNSGDSFSTLYQRADTALYAAKEKGRNQYCIDARALPPPKAEAAACAEANRPGEAFRADKSLSPIQLQALLEHMDGGVLLFEIGEALRIRYLSPSFYKFTHIPMDAPNVDGVDLLSMVEEPDRSALVERLREGARTDTPVDFSYRVVTYRGAQTWRHIRAVRIRREESGNPMMIAVITDITEIKKTSAMLDAIVEHSPLGIGVFDLSHGFKPVFVNRVLLRMFNFGEEEFFAKAGANALSMVDQKDLPMVRALIDKVGQGDGRAPEEIVYHPAERKGMPRRSIRANGLRIPGSVGETLVLVMFNDITEQETALPPAGKAPEEVARPQKRRILIVDDSEVNRGVLRRILDSEYEVLEAENGNEALEMLSYSYETVSAVLLDLIMPVMDGCEVLAKMRADINLSKIPVIVTSGSAQTHTEVKALSLGANDFIVKPYNPAVIRHRLGNTINLRETAAFVNAVERDELTGLYSKAFFYKKAESVLRAHPERSYDLVCCDIERFKLVNELFGERMADQLLQHVSSLLVRQVNGGGVYGRIGVDKFACLIPHRAGYAAAVFEDIARSVNAFPISFNISLCYGVYVVEDASVPVSTMCDRALTACNSVKGKYGVYYAYYDDAFRKRLLAEQVILDSMRQGLAERQFQVHYQPKYSLATGAVVGAEALVRWQHPTRGFMPPGEFIPLFERNGFITDLDRYVWETVCAGISDWLRAGRTPPPISVNVSRADLYNPELAAILAGLLDKYGLPVELLHLEITETAYTEDSEQLVGAVERLRALGFIIEMDDFGTGYSSLNMLSELPIHILKLDLRFIRPETDDFRKANVLEVVIDLARRLRLPVVAEGVETAEQARALREMGCDYAQGYYFARPMPREDFERHLLEASMEAMPAFLRA